MTDRLATDTNAVIDLLRIDRADPPPLKTTQEIVLPLPVIGELLAGAYASRQREANVIAIEHLVDRWSLIAPDLDTARVYGRLRAPGHARDLTAARMNDLWIAAICIQHGLPLLTNDRGFDRIASLTVIHW